MNVCEQVQLVLKFCRKKSLIYLAECFQSIEQSMENDLPSGASLNIIKFLTNYVHCTVYIKTLSNKASSAGRANDVLFRKW